ncbi:MAG: DNA translocase FtsK 4TM domain-containing protein [Acidobacteriota bacterium]
MPSVARKPFPRLSLSSDKGSEIVGMVLTAIVVLLAGSLLSYHPLDPSVLHRVTDDGSTTRNLIGPFGAHLAALAIGFLGLVALLVPILLGFLAWSRLTCREIPPVSGRSLGLVAVLFSLPAMLQVLLGKIAWRGELLDSGGALGVVLTDMLTAQLNPGGAFVILLTVFLIGGSLAAKSTLGDVARVLRGQAHGVVEKVRLTVAQRSKRTKERSAHRRVIQQARRSADSADRGEPAPKASPKPTIQRKSLETDDAEEAPRVDLPLRVTEKKGVGRFAVRKVLPAGAPAPSEEPPAREPEQKEIGFAEDEMALTELPPVNLLSTDPIGKAHDEAELVRLGELIRESAGHFGIEGTIEGISPGPVVTVFEFQPAPGIKVSRIVGLQDDLALALKAESVRIERLPGRSTLGVEVPNDSRSMISLGHLLDHNKFSSSPSVLTMALGVDIYGRPYYSDLATMPHLLVAGATGAGKSVGLQSMITSIIYKATREQVQFIFIDPKRIELGVYADIPHLKTEVVVNPKKAANALRWAVAEMERRYRLLAEVHVRSIGYYNRAITDPKERKRLALKEGDSEFNPEDFKPLPYYVIVIDELADLMMVASSDVETSIARLAQMARAVGIHLIIATQRPSVDVLTGTIKANFPCRLSYATATRHDSRTILDQVGAEKLLGKGDALFMAPGTSRIFRMHGAYISEQETASLIRWLKRRGKPDLDLDVLKAPETSSEGGGGAGSDADDALFDEAARLVVVERQASASYLQRRLRVGFSRAARIIDMLEADGLLGPAQGSKSREVLVPPDYFEEIDRARAGEG